ncbi:TPA: DGQHR domain-containing protein [Streptococcus suis]|nr:DGQHR domain-containing protein [Streptococcus suis]HEL9630237.1 DGQHR domain-containing protein [Streptococcus suis]
MSEFPFIEINQNDSAFYLTKMNVSFLRETVNFHFRSSINAEADILKATEYTERLEKKLGLSVHNESEGIQRRTDLKRIDDISKFVKEAKSIVFPTPLVLSVDVFNSDDSSFAIDEEKNCFKFGKNIRFTIIDGQHRLAGLVKAYNEYGIDIEMPVTLVIDADLSTASKLFIDINGNQRKVNKSMVYDLYENIDEDKASRISQYTNAVRALNTKEGSPFYGRIKMLGTGSGTISQSFLVDYLIDVWKNNDSLPEDTQTIFSEAFVFFKLVSMVYEKQWALEVIMKDNSLLVKTNGIGALLLLLSDLIHQFGRPSENQQLYLDFFRKRENFDWEVYTGTGKAIQKKIKDDFMKFPERNRELELK